MKGVNRYGGFVVVEQIISYCVNFFNERNEKCRINCKIYIFESIGELIK